MKKSIFTITLLMTIAVFFSVNATSYYPDEKYFPIGSVINLFQSGTEEIRNEISVHDTLTIYRFDKSCSFENVGRIEIISFNGRYFLSGKIVSGKIKIGDIVKKGAFACIIIASNDNGACQ